MRGMENTEPPKPNIRMLCRYFVSFQSQITGNLFEPSAAQKLKNPYKSMNFLVWRRLRDSNCPGHSILPTLSFQLLTEDNILVL